MKKIILVVSLLAIIAGCGPRGYWVKDGVSDQDFSRERYECSYRAQQLCNYWDSRTNAISGIICVQGRFNECMYGFGYSWVQEEKRKQVNSDYRIELIEDGKTNLK
jgi:hypothetical protein